MKRGVRTPQSYHIVILEAQTSTDDNKQNE